MGLWWRDPGLSCSEPWEVMEELLLAHGARAPTTAPLCQPPVPPVPLWRSPGLLAPHRGVCGPQWAQPPWGGGMAPARPEPRGLPGHHGGCSQYPSLGDTPACAAYDAGAGCSSCWDVGVHGPRRPRRHSDASSGEGPGTRSPSAMENPGVESPQSHSELPFPMMLQEGPRVLHPRNRATAVGGFLSLW